MQVVSAAEGIGRSASHGVKINRRSYPILDAFKKAYEITVPADAVLAIAASLGELEKENFGGGVLVFREWNLWSPDTESIGQKCVGLALAQTDINPNAPLFVAIESSDLLSFQVLIMQALIFAWDAFYVPNSEQYVIFISHERLAYVIPTNLSTSTNAAILLAELDAQEVMTPYYLSSQD